MLALLAGSDMFPEDIYRVFVCHTALVRRCTASMVMCCGSTAEVSGLQATCEGVPSGCFQHMNYVQFTTWACTGGMVSWHVPIAVRSNNCALDPSTSRTTARALENIARSRPVAWLSGIHNSSEGGRFAV